MHPRQVKRLANVESAQIRAARAMLGWSQQKLAERSGVSPRTVAHVELETRVPKQETIVQLATTLQEAGIVFGRTRDFSPSIALKRASDAEGPARSATADAGS